MTREIHTVILEVALALLLEESDDELEKRAPWMTRESVEWCFENPVYPDTELETAIERIIKTYG